MKVELSQFDLSSQDRKDFKKTISWFKRFEKNPEGSLTGVILKPAAEVIVKVGNKS